MIYRIHQDALSRYITITQSHIKVNLFFFHCRLTINESHFGNVLFNEHSNIHVYNYTVLVQ